MGAKHVITVNHCQKWRGHRILEWIPLVHPYQAICHKIIVFLQHLFFQKRKHHNYTMTCWHIFLFGRYFKRPAHVFHSSAWGVLLGQIFWQGHNFIIIPAVLWEVAIGDSGRSPHKKVSAVCLYDWRERLSSVEISSFEPKKLTLDNRTWVKG